MLTRLLGLLVPPLCIACGADAGRATPICRDCRAAMSAGGGRQTQLLGLDCYAAFTYDGPAGAVVRALKFGGRAALADVMAAQLVAHAPPCLLHGTVVPVPVHPLHRRRRGVDHSHALAAALARRAGLPLSACLVRTGDPRPQVGRGRRERIGGPLGAIAVKPGIGLPQATLIVDDVVTTGATIAACIRALRVAGATPISALTYARTTAR
jgi:predicted amidophosphoribosyltransferase